MSGMGGAGPVRTGGGGAGPMRMGGGGGVIGKFKRISEQAVPYLAWASWLLALASSPLLAGTFVGGFIDNIISVLPSVVPLIAMVWMGVRTIRDIGLDGVPNMEAFWYTLLFCSVARSVGGRFGDRVEGFANTILSYIREPLSAELGTGSALALALCGALAAFIVAERTMAPKGGGR